MEAITDIPIYELQNDVFLSKRRKKNKKNSVALILGFSTVSAFIFLFFRNSVHIIEDNPDTFKESVAMASSPTNLIFRQCAITLEFPGTVILGRPTNTEMTFNIFSDENFDAYIEAIPDNIGSSSQVSPIVSVQSGKTTVISLSMLLPNTHYRYTIVRIFSDGSVICTPSHGFQTQRSPSSSFKFAVIADSHLGTAKHCDPTRYAQTLHNVQASNPDFVLSLGDDFRATMLKDPVTSAAVEEIYQNQLPYFSIFAEDAALFTVAGNHELQSGWLLNRSYNSIPAWVIRSRVAHISNPRPNYFYSGGTTQYKFLFNGLLENFYAWRWGPALFVALDNYFYSQGEYGWPVSLGHEQFFWLKTVMFLPITQAASFKFIFHHHLCGSERGGIEWADYYEWGGYTPKVLGDKNSIKSWDFETMRPGWGNKAIHQILVASKVNVVFQGHDHLYVKQDHPDGIVYLTVPFPGFNHDTFWGGEYDNSIVFRSGTILSPSGHISVEVTPSLATISYINSRLPGDDPLNGANGASAHSFQLERK